MKVTKKMLDAYCTAWKAEFQKRHPYERVTFTAELRRYIKVGLEAALHAH